MSPTAPPAIRWSARLLWALVVSALAFLLAFLALRAAWVVPFPFAVENGEGTVLAWTNQLRAGRLPYHAFTTFPWNFAVYTPGYFAASAALATLLPEPAWLAGRLISFGSALAAAGLLVQQMPRRAGWLRWLPAALWLASPYLFRWSTFHRPDMFALAWSTGGLVLTLHAVRRDQPRWLVTAALCFVAGFWSKQSFFAAPLAATLWLLWQRRHWLPWLIGPGVAGGLAVALLLWALSGPALFENLVLANANAFSWEALWRFQESFVGTVSELIILALLALALRQTRAQPGTTLFGLALLIAWAVSFTVGKAGAWENYFLESLWLLCALAGRAALTLQPRGGWVSVLLPLLLLLQLLAFLPAFERSTPAEERAWLDELHAEQSALHAVVEPLPPEAVIWSEEAGLLADSQRPVPLFVFGYTQLAAQGLWDPTPLTTRLATGADPLLVQRWDALSDPLGLQRWSRSMLDASERGYALGTRAGRWIARPPLPFPAADQPQALGSGIELLNWMALTVDAACHVPSRGLCPDTRLESPIVLRPGPLAIHTLWRSDQPREAGLSVSAQLFDGSGERVAQADGPLRVEGLGGPWPAGALVRDERNLDVAEGLPAGEYTLLLAIYLSESGEGLGTITLPGFVIQ